MSVQRHSTKRVKVGQDRGEGGAVDFSAHSVYEYPSPVVQVLREVINIRRKDTVVVIVA